LVVEVRTIHRLGLRPVQWAALAFPAAGAIFLAVYQAMRPFAFAGIQTFAGYGYDDGVHIGTALRLTDLQFPYKDYLFLHPPGIAVFLSPLALIGRIFGEQQALIAGRLFTSLIVVLNVVFVGYLVRRRGACAMLAAGSVLAFWPLAADATKSIMLEPYVVFFMLLGMLVLFENEEFASRRRIQIAGLFFGFAAAVKLVAVLPIAAAIVVASRRPRRELFPLASGIAAGFGLIVLPFAILAPANFFDQVLSTQLSRHPALSVDQSITYRITMILGIAREPKPSQAPLALLVFAVLAILITGVYISRRGRTTKFDIFVLVGLVISIAAELRSPDLFPHYAYLSTVFLALVIAICVGEILQAIALVVPTDSRAQKLRIASWVVAAVVVLASAIALPRSQTVAREITQGSADPSAWMRESIPQGSCVMFDVPTLVIVGDRLLSDDPDCPALIDPFGMWLNAEAHLSPSMADTVDPELAQTWISYLEKADFLVLSVDFSNFVPWNPELRAWFSTNYRKVGSQSQIVLYRKV
jgi:hypothetical protein